jgi:hypothetical protein
MEIYKNLSLENLPSEEWRDIAGYENSYLISNYGRVKSLPKKVIIRRDTGAVRPTKEKILAQKLSRGYSKTQLPKINGKGNYITHRLVAQAFIPNPDNKPEVNHIDCVKHNNHVSNLEWVTQEENHLHAVAMGKCIPKKIRNPKQFNLNHNQHKSKKVYKYKMDGTLIAWYISFGEAARRNNTKSNTLSKIVKDRKHHSHKGFYYLDFPLMTFSKEEKLNKIRAKECDNPPTLHVLTPINKCAQPV